MNKRVLVLTTSLRNGSNSQLLAEAFAKGAKSSGCDVEVVSLKNKKINYCLGCLHCQETQKCVITDDMGPILKKIALSEVVVFATPVYFYEMAGQMKTLLDRTNPLYQDTYRFKDVYLLATAADTDLKAIENIKSGLEGWISCFEGVSLVDYIFAGGMVETKTTLSQTILDKAYQMGFNIGGKNATKLG